MMKSLATPLDSTAEEEVDLIDLQLSFSTADIEASVFHGSTPPLGAVYLWPKVPSGTYYLLDGKLRPVVQGAPPGSVPLSEESGLLRLGHGTE